ncbi:two component transcriptional regulator, winged helix family [Catenulispora acidiphila DSM 44928]|uniref:Two component transcriptional regulator, winged helix family n=1 Tax=Catenulispora acidiphila (strain DSM 44928 / JCM 14897 / NBRC 102108 / NRRL B-24433 / ID139908) TaxID=479433 RepID=C7QI13_CATAD|nr:response regulator transcription factor [Catenulispora acidiphila]ACU73058.1 two component transcriptional regulator, winged helix family [Catenulispora acidiphila DSM 44928]
MSAYILIVEDDPKQAELIRVSLQSEGYRTAIAHDAPSAFRSVEDCPPDLVVLDLMLPGADGLTICRWLRRRGETPVLMVTARSTEDDVLAGLDVGADDYMTKPYSPRELVARIRTVLRRSRPAATTAAIATAANATGAKEAVLQVGGLLVDPARHSVLCDGRPVACTPDEFAVLAALAAAPGRVFTRAQLLRHTRGFDRASTERAVDVHVLNLRKKIEANPARPTRLLTVYGVGYKLVGAR